MGSTITKVIKKNIFISILSVIALIMLATGISYALFIKEDFNTDNQIISVGSIEASLSSSTGVLSISNLSPKKYSSLEPNENTYSFTVTNTGEYTLQYEVYLVDNTNEFLSECEDMGGCPNFSNSRLRPESFNYINFKSGNTIGNFGDIYREGKKTLGTGTILPNEAKTYTIQIWLDPSSSNDVIGKTASFNIKLNAVAIDTPIESDKDELSIGDIVKIGSEEFYVISKSGDTVRMISKYNIRVGVDVTSAGIIPIQETDSLYNRQDPISLGPPLQGDYYNSVIHFTDEDHAIIQRGFNSYQGSILQEKINSYANYLRNVLGADVVGDAPTSQDLSALKSIKDYYQTSFWTKTNVPDSTDASLVITYKREVENIEDVLKGYSGVRPVISANIKNIKKKIYLDNTNITVDTTTLQNSNLVTGSIVSIGDEKFYVISETKGVVRMLAKENLNCGYNGETPIDINIDTIAQQSITDEKITIPFSTLSHKNEQDICLDLNKQKSHCFSSFKNSEVEYFANLYKDALYKKYQASVQVDLLTEDDLKHLDYMPLVKSFGANTFTWVYSTNYWTKETTDNENIYTVSKTNKVETKQFEELKVGLRPVVIIHKKQISNLP